MKTALCEVQRIFESITAEGACIPGTLLYNEGWLLRLVLAAGSKGTDCLPFRFEPTARWFSEALLYSAFLPRFRGDPLAESLTHADGVVGQFLFDAATKAGLVLEPKCSQFVVCEAKVFSGLSAGVKRALFFDQAARNVGCMAETLCRTGRRTGRPISLYKSLGFFVLAPESQIKAGVFSGQMTKDGIRDRLRQRIQMYDGQQPKFIELQKWLDEWALPLVDRMELSCCSWESVIDQVSVTHPEYGASLREFYQLCLKYNAGAGTIAAGVGS
ncbi:MAG: hypothetical protein ABSD88_09625 [Candidatus Korobacteraceae bacterium]